MPIPSSAILALARVKLNDPNSAIYNDTVLLPMLDAAYDEMQLIFERNGVPVQNEISDVLTVPANTLVLSADSTPALPSDFLYPIRLFERDNGSTDDSAWVLMTQQRWEPNIQQQPTLIWWVWRKDVIEFVGATQIREVKIHYKMALEAIAADDIDVSPIGAKSYLASRTAMQAALYIGENESRAAALQQEAELAMDNLLGRMVNSQQALPVRRLPYRVRGWRGYGNY